MLNLYELHNRKEKLEKYKAYCHLIECLIDEEYDINYNYGPVMHIIKKEPDTAFYYARDIIKDRWPEGEPYIMWHPFYAYCYARIIIKGRWPDAEPYIMKSPWNADYYARHVIKGRWIEAEPIIKPHEYQWQEYCKVFKI